MINHPTLKQDHLVQVFLTEPNLEQWRKTTPITLEEELKGKKLSEREEMEIPGDALEKLESAFSLAGLPSSDAHLAFFFPLH